MEDEKSSKAIGVQWFIPVVPCSSQLNYSIRSCAFQAKRSPEVPNLSFRLPLFKHKALLSSASLYSSLYAAFCRAPRPSAPSVMYSAHSYCCHHSLLPGASYTLSRQVLLPSNSSPLNTACCCSAPAGISSWRSPVSVHHPLSSHLPRSLLLLFPCSHGSFYKWVCIHN